MSIEPDILSKLPFWKKLRRQILLKVVHDNFFEYDDCFVPTNIVHSAQKKNIADIREDDRETVLFDHFLINCRRGMNTPFIQCVQAENKIIWFWSDDYFKKQNANLCRWLDDCFRMATTLFELQLITTRLRNDKTRGYMINVFCSFIIRFLRKNVFDPLDELYKMEGKNLLTLQKCCMDLHAKFLKPLYRIANQIEKEDIIGGEFINFLFDQKSLHENRYLTSILDDIISLSIERYYQIIVEWVSSCTLALDVGHEFFIWDLRKQNVVDRSNFDVTGKLDWSEFKNKFLGLFDNYFILIPQLIPVDFLPVKDQIFKFGKYLYTMKQQNAGLTLLSFHYSLEASVFKNLSLGKFCDKINELFEKCSTNTLEHFKQKYDIINFAKKLPSFFIGLNTNWIYELGELFEKNNFTNIDIEKLTSNKLNGLLTQAFRYAQLDTTMHYKYFELNISPFTKIKSEGITPKKGTFPALELNIAQNNHVLKLAFPAKILEPYRRVFFLLFVINRARYLVHILINVYQEYICGIAAKEYNNFVKKLEKVKNLDELVQVQLEYIHIFMENAKLDQEYLPIRQLIEGIANQFCLYACNELTFFELNKSVSPFVGKLKHFLLTNRKVGELKNL
uniref:Gamma-tubulin complex component n=1 Tax=Meloidogyne floridensis TaxID=298350 RepID=A0A915NZY3_9BILA